MSVLDMLGQVFIGPLKLIFELIFYLAYTLLKNPGLSIVVLSLAMNILVLPLYRRADKIQEKARDTQKRLKPTVDHIKKTFSGDERMMILQTFYRQNNYNPLSALSGSLSLLLQIPFFMAAYQFLSSLAIMQKVSFGPIADLSRPDGLLVIGGLTINLLPIVMTAVNVLGSSLYLKGFPLKTKLQLYAMALFFLVFLYNSPAALVFYWTLNNVFSLFKTLYYKMKHSRTILNVALALCGVGCWGLAFVLNGLVKTAFFAAMGLVAQLPWLLPLLKKKISLPQKSKEIPKPKTSFFVVGALFLTVLVGLYIPATYLAASPQEYIDPFYFYNPLWYAVESLCLAAGLFLVWLGVFYWLAPAKGRRIFQIAIWSLCAVMLVNYLFFGTNLGMVTPNLQYTDGLSISQTEKLINLGVVALVVFGVCFLGKRFSRATCSVLLIGSLAMTAMGTVNMVKVGASAQETREQISQDAVDTEIRFSMSTEGQNVVVIMLDRGISQFIPYIMEEDPQLKQQFDGFTFYSNTMAYGGFTNFGTPPLYGGYDYTPEQMNKRDDELLVDKHNEALKVMPTLFGEADYEVTVIDPSYAGYQQIPDLSIYDGMENVAAYLADGRFSDHSSSQTNIQDRRRNFLLFSLMKTQPLLLQGTIYDFGNYCKVPDTVQITDSSYTNQYIQGFLNAYNVLKNMDSMTQVTDEKQNTFMFLRSNATHEPVILQEPNFQPTDNINNDAYYSEEGKWISDGTNRILLSNVEQISHYHSNMASLMQLGNWFDYLREIGVYDNTRIILVSDHGRHMGLFTEEGVDLTDVELYQALLLEKDFNAKGFTVINEFMTNGDVPYLATEGLLESAVNPFTGNSLDGTEIKKQPQWSIVSWEWNVAVNKGTQFLPSQWATVNGDVTKESNWSFTEEESVLPPS